jgi:O-antigen/teichoic acid export membrane protein
MKHHIHPNMKKHSRQSSTIQTHTILAEQGIHSGNLALWTQRAPASTTKVAVILKGLNLSRWARQFAATLVAQTGVQAIAFASGIFIIRLLPQKEFALYTLANAALGMMTALADSGVSAGLMSLAAPAAGDPSRLATVIQTGFHVRRLFAAFGLLVAVPWSFFLLRSHGADWPAALLLIATLLPSFLFAISASILQIPLQLRRRIGEVQLSALGSNSVRFMLLVITLPASTFAAIALLCNAAGTLLQSFWLRWLQRDLRRTRTSIDPEVRAQLLRLARRLIPGSVYYAFHSQITLWLISLFGTTVSVAEVGALTRLTMALSILSAAINVAVVPRFALLSATAPIVRMRFLQVQVLLTLLSIPLLLCVWIFPNAVLFVLGRHYAGLTSQLLLATASAYVSLMSSIVFSLNTSRGWVAPGYLFPIIGTLTTVILVMTMRIVSTTDAMIFSLLSNFASLATGYAVFFVGVRHCSNVVAQSPK